MSEEEFIIEQLFEEEKLTDKQKKIILAAIETFSEKGYAATSTSEIAKKAGVAEGTIFRHYKTKKELLMSIVAPSLAKLIAPFVVKDFNKVLDRQYDRVEDFFRATLENRRDILIRLLPVIKILLQEVPFQQDLKKHLEQIAQTIFDRVSDLIKGYQEKGQLIEMPTESVARLAITSIMGFLVSRYILFPQFNWDDEVEIDRTIEFIMHGLGKRD